MDKSRKQKLFGDENIKNESCNQHLHISIIVKSGVASFHMLVVIDGHFVYSLAYCDDLEINGVKILNLLFLIYQFLIVQ